MSSSGKIYPAPTYIPPLPVFNPIYFPQSFGTTTSSGGGGGGGGTNIFPLGLTSGNVITMNGGTGGGGGGGEERTITGLSQIEWADYTSINPATITGYMVLNGGTLEIGSNTPSSGINVNLLGSSVLANGSAIGNVLTTTDNTFINGSNQTFNGEITVDNTQSNIGQYPYDNTGIGFEIFNNLTTGEGNTAVGISCLTTSTIDNGNTAVGYFAGQNLNGNGSDSDHNTFVGFLAGGQQITGSNNLALGYSCGVGISNLSNTIAIGNQVSTAITGDMILGFGGDYNNTGASYYAKITPNTTTNQGIILQGEYNGNDNFAIESSLIQIQNISSSGLAGELQIQSGSNGGGSLQVQDSGTNPPTNTGYGNFASVNGLPFYYSPSTSTWSQLTTGASFFTITTDPGVYNSGTIPPETSWTINTGIPNYGNSFNYTIATTKPLTNQVYTNATPLTLNNSFSITTGTAIIQNYTINGFPGFGYLFSGISTLGSGNTSNVMTYSAEANESGGICTTSYSFVLQGNYAPSGEPLIITGFTT